MSARLLAVPILLLFATLADALHAAQPSEPISNFAAMPVHTRGATPSPSQVREAIIAAGEQIATVGGNAWQFEEIAPGQLIGKLRWGPHGAEIAITYSPESYSVVYRGSTNLGYEPDGPNIHPTYNKLIKALVFRIQSTLSWVDGDPTRVIPPRGSRGAPVLTAQAAASAPSSQMTIAVSISAGPGTKRSRSWAALVAEWQNYMPGAASSVGADLLTVREGEPAAMRQPGTLVAVNVNYFRFVSPVRYYARPPARQGTPSNASLDVTVRFFDLLTGDPVGTERAYLASGRNGGEDQTTNLQVRDVAYKIMADWRSSLAAAPVAPATLSAPRMTPQAAASATSGADRAEISFWESVRDSTNAAELQAYLDQYPNGAFAPLAKARLAAVRSGGPR